MSRAMAPNLKDGTIRTNQAFSIWRCFTSDNQLQPALSGHLKRTWKCRRRQVCQVLQEALWQAPECFLVHCEKASSMSVPGPGVFPYLDDLRPGIIVQDAWSSGKVLSSFSQLLMRNIDIKLLPRSTPSALPVACLFSDLPSSSLASLFIVHLPCKYHPLSPIARPRLDDTGDLVEHHESLGHMVSVTFSFLPGMLQFTSHSFVSLWERREDKDFV